MLIRINTMKILIGRRTDERGVSRHTTAGLFVVLAAVWGTSFVAARAALPFVPPLPLAAMRFDVATLVVFAYAVVTAERLRPRTREGWASVLVAGLLFVAVHHALLFAGQRYVTSTVAAVVVSLDPVLAAGFAWALLPDEGIGAVGAVGLTLGLLGVGVVASPDPDALLSADVVGIGLVFLSAAAFALGAVLTRRYRTTLPVQSMQAWAMGVGAVLLHVAERLLPWPGFGAVDPTPTAAAAVLYLAVVAGGVGYLLYFELLDRLGPVEINLVGYVAPLFAALGGWLLLGEAVDPSTVAGFCLVVAGFALVKRDALRAELADVRRTLDRRR